MRPEDEHAQLKEAVDVVSCLVHTQEGCRGTGAQAIVLPSALLFLGVACMGKEHTMHVWLVWHSYTSV